MAGPFQSYFLVDFKQILARKKIPWSTRELILNVTPPIRPVQSYRNK